MIIIYIFKDTILTGTLVLDDNSHITLEFITPNVASMLIFLIFSFHENVMVLLKIVKSPLREVDGLEICNINK